MNDKIKYILSVIGGFIATATKQYGLILLFVVIGIVFDFVTGLVKSKITGVPWSSKRGFIGFSRRCFSEYFWTTSYPCLLKK